METTIEIVSVQGGKFHRPDSVVFNGGSNVFRDARLMRCGRSLVPLNVFETIADADRHTGGRLDRYICQQCERKVSHLWRVPEVLKNEAVHVHNKLTPMESKAHTPGPWKVAGSCHVKPAVDGRFYHVAHVSLADDYAENPMIAEVSNRGRYTSEREAHIAGAEQAANARLIAAAPTMYAAIDKAQARLDDMPNYLRNNDARILGDIVAECLQEMRDALTLADGFKWQDRREGAA